MSNLRRDYEQELSFLMKSIAKSIAKTSAEALLAECRDDRIDIVAAADKTKAVLNRALKEHKKHKLAEARAEYISRVMSMQKRTYALPEPIQRKRALLERIFAMKPSLGSAVTAAARNFQELTDGDVDLMLQQLQELGALDDSAAPDSR